MSDEVALDHLVLATPDLAATVADFAARTGVQPAAGGSHLGLGTANYLVRLTGASSYLEIVGPDRHQPEPDQPRPFGIDDLDAARVVTWALRCDALDATITRAREHGYDPGEPTGMSRRTADGELLSWRLTPTDTRLDGLVPFLIDWGSTPHPTTRDLPEIAPAALRMTHPDPDAVREAHAALELYDVEVDQADTTTIELTVETAGVQIRF